MKWKFQNVSYGGVSLLFGLPFLLIRLQLLPTSGHSKPTIEHAEKSAVCNHSTGLSCQIEKYGVLPVPFPSQISSQRQRYLWLATRIATGFLSKYDSTH